MSEIRDHNAYMKEKIDAVLRLTIDLFKGKNNRVAQTKDGVAWTHTVFARDQNGKEISYMDYDACQFCVSGAIILTMNTHQETWVPRMDYHELFRSTEERILRAVERHTPEKYDAIGKDPQLRQLAHWNDKVCQSKDEAIMMLTFALEEKMPRSKRRQDED